MVAASIKTKKMATAAVADLMSLMLRRQFRFI